MNYGVESVDKKERDVTIARFSLTKVLLLKYVEPDSKPVNSGKKQLS